MASEEEELGIPGNRGVMFCKLYQKPRGAGQPRCPHTARLCPNGQHRCSACGQRGHGKADCGRREEQERRRGDSEGRALQSVDEAVDENKASSAISLLEVKEEVDGEEVCRHTETDAGGKPWPLKSSFETWVWSGNKKKPEEVPSLIQTLDSVMFQANMRAWSDMQCHMDTHQESFDWYYSNTGSGSRGFAMMCRRCTRVLKISWSKQDDWQSEKLESCRRQLRAFLGYGSASPVKRQRIV